MALTLAVLPGAARAKGPPAGVPPQAAPGTPPVPRVAVGWPVGDRPRVLRGWEPPLTPYGAGHRGVDLEAGSGLPVRSPVPGRVTFAGPVGGKGVIVVELTGSGEPPLRTTYEPVRASVRKGATIQAGEQLGTVTAAGASHCAGRCLHWGLRRADAYLDPLTLLPSHLLRGAPVRLLPVYGVPEPPQRVRQRTGRRSRPDHRRIRQPQGHDHSDGRGKDDSPRGALCRRSVKRSTAAGRS
ncbi:M23 family metallopeptidase [Streptomyces sp. NPDC091377]|uniref:M23 family metallopeptidase n=1 Tax=Streptomyces sp. NPDC091377 TaxID=3365995 RepID=UPI0038048F1B